MSFEEAVILASVLDCIGIGRDQDDNVVLVYPISPEGDCVRVDTFQANGWIRINYYWSDGTVEEMYERDCKD